MRRDERVHCLQRGVDGRLFVRDGGTRLVKVAAREICARFLQGLARRVERGARGPECAGGDAGGLCSLQPALEFFQMRGERDDAGFGLAARGRLAVGRGARRVLPALARVERVAERLFVVALLDGVVRFLQRGGGRAVLVFRVLLGAGGARRVDGALCLIEFFLGRFRTARDEEQAEQHRQATHRSEV